jgi:hypothetical protein
MSLVSKLLDLLMHRPRGITGKGMPSAEGKGAQWGPADAPPLTSASPEGPAPRPEESGSRDSNEPEAAGRSEPGG